MLRIIFVTVGVVVTVTLVVGGFTLNQANQQQLTLSSDLQYRTRVLADSLIESIQPPFAGYATTTVQRIVDKIATNAHLVGLGVFDNNSQPVVTSDGLPPEVLSQTLITTVMDTDTPSGMFIQASGQSSYLFVEPLHNNDHIIGALAVVQNASYIDAAVWQVWRDNLMRLLLQVFFITIAIIVLVRWVFFRSLADLTENIRAIRRGEAVAEGNGRTHSFLSPVTNEVSMIAMSLRQARSSASEEARMRLEKLDSPWTAERLKEFIKAFLKDRTIFMVSNLEPYIHRKVKNEIKWKVPASGLITALEPVMEACGGVWIAAGTGDADKLTVDGDDKLRVPPDDPRYALKRVWLTDEERTKYERGFAGDALWPLCHLTHTRPIFRHDDWEEYRRVNDRFAKIILTEIEHAERPIVLLQDFHFTLLPSIIKKARPDAQVGLFWHIPWPNAEIFSICPWKKEILEGMLGADVLGFHTQQFCNNFIETVSKEIEVLVDFDQFSITRGGHTCYIKPFPIGTAFSNGQQHFKTSSDRKILEKYGINTKYVGFGVERMDPIKGILERFKAIEIFLEMYPSYVGQFTFLQVTAPSNQTVDKNRLFTEAVRDEIDRVNKKFTSHNWQPIVHVDKSHTHEEIVPLYQAADLLLVTSLHDGMNLVSKEFVAARNDELGVLVLSQFTGAARELKGALIVNPYDARQTAEAIHVALTLSKAEQRLRMKKMRDIVKSYNIYRWSAEFIKALTQTE